MTLRPPDGSKLAVKQEGSDTIIVIPHADNRVMRYGTGLFLLAWLGGWTAGMVHAVSEIVSGRAPAFLYLWLIMWTAGGVFAVYWAYRQLRPVVPESLRLRRSSVFYDPGTPYLQTTWGGRQDAWKNMFAKRVLRELDRRQLQSLRLRETDAGNRLTLDADAVRLELASGASEVEREWLHQVLVQRYALAPTQ
jgi:hypothetical protein